MGRDFRNDRHGPGRGSIWKEILARKGTTEGPSRDSHDLEGPLWRGRLGSGSGGEVS